MKLRLLRQLWSNPLRQTVGKNSLNVSFSVGLPTAPAGPKSTVRMATTGTGSELAARARAQLTDTLYMVKPTYFDFNAETAVDNAFQKRSGDLTLEEVRRKAHGEFQALVAKLESRKIRLFMEDCAHERASDAVFPNNMLSFQNEDGKPRIVLYPMKSENRRLERQPTVIASWRERLRAEVLDYSAFEREGMFLEGTGSMVLDRANRIVYSCMSQRTYPLVLEKFCSDFGYRPIVFESSTRTAGGELQQIYHTNVMMSVGDRFAVVAFETIRRAEEQQVVREALESTGKELVVISEAQVNEFVGNVLQIRNPEGDKFLVCSTRAFNAMEARQLAVLRKHCDDVLHVPLDTIEQLGGGGARCMLCEVFPSPN